LAENSERTMYAKAVASHESLPLDNLVKLSQSKKSSILKEVLCNKILPLEIVKELFNKKIDGFNSVNIVSYRNKNEDVLNFIAENYFNDAIIELINNENITFSILKKNIFIFKK